MPCPGIATALAWQSLRAAPIHQCGFLRLIGSISGPHSVDRAKGNHAAALLLALVRHFLNNGQLPRLVVAERALEEAFLELHHTIHPIATPARIKSPTGTPMPTTKSTNVQRHATVRLPPLAASSHLDSNQPIGSGIFCLPKVLSVEGHSHQ